MTDFIVKWNRRSGEWVTTYAHCDAGECRFGVLGAGGVRADIILRYVVLSAANILANFWHSFVDAAWNVISTICHHRRKRNFFEIDFN